MSKKLKIYLSIFLLVILAWIGTIVWVYLSTPTPKSEETEGPPSPFSKVSQTPRLTGPIENLAELPEETIKIKVSSAGFEPDEFEVSQGNQVNLVLTSLDGTHSLVFQEPELSKVKISVGRGESRGISFIAPQKGDYHFYCPIPGHQGTGIMHVKPR